MAELAGITQSVTRAWRLLNQTGFMETSRGLNTEAWQSNLREAVRELREAAQSLVRRDNRDAYGELNNMQRELLWQSILAARAPATGVYIISRLGGQYPNMPQHVRAADRILSSRANGFPVATLRAMTSTILNAAPSRETAVEQEAARQGDPMPRRITPEEGRLYQQIVLQAIQLSNREVISHRNAGEAALEAFGESFLPSIHPGNILNDQFEERGLTASLGEQGAQRAGLVISIVRALNDAADAHYRANHPEYRLNHWINQVCLAESGNDQGTANRLLNQLQDIKRRMNAWLEWLQRHQEHPAYVPPYGRLDATPTASVDRTDLTRTGINNCCGPVQGPVRGAANRGPTGLA